MVDVNVDDLVDMVAKGKICCGKKKMDVHWSQLACYNWLYLLDQLWQVLVELVGGFEGVGLMARMLPTALVHLGRENQ